MGHFIHHPLIVESVAVLEEKLAQEEIDEMLASIEASSPKEAFNALWLGLAKEHPQIFSVSSLRPGALASDYLTRYCHQDLAGYKGNEEETRELGLSLNAINLWLGSRVTVRYRAFRRSCGLLRAYADYHNWVGWVHYDKMFRDTIWLDNQFIRDCRLEKDYKNVAALLTHENIHCLVAKAALAEPHRDFPLLESPLVNAVDEACTSFLEIMAMLADDQGLINCEAVEEEISGHYYKPVIEALQGLIGKEYSPSLAREVFSLATDNLQVAHLAETVERLNRYEVTGDLVFWEKYFSLPHS